MTTPDNSTHVTVMADVPQSQVGRTMFALQIVRRLPQRQTLFNTLWVALAAGLTLTHWAPFATQVLDDPNKAAGPLVWLVSTLAWMLFGTLPFMFLVGGFALNRTKHVHLVGEEPWLERLCVTITMLFVSLIVATAAAGLFNQYAGQAPLAIAIALQLVVPFAVSLMLNRISDGTCPA